MTGVSGAVKSVAFRLPMRFRLIPPFEPLLLPLEVPVPVVVLLTLLFSEILVLVGGVTPRVRVLSRLTCMTTTSTTTSGLALSRSSTSFCASAS